MEEVNKTEIFKNNPYLYVITLLLAAKFILFSSEFFTLAYENIVFTIFPKTEFTQNLLELSSFIFITLLVLFFARKFYKLSYKTLGFIRKNALKDFLRGFFFGAVVLILCVSVMIVSGVARISSITFNLKLFLQFIPLLIVWSIQGNAEEMLTRGLLFSVISKKLNILSAILISSLFFTIMHLGNDNIALLPLIDLFVFAVFAALVMIKSKNIWIVSGFHAAWNCFQGNVFSFPVSGTKLGNAFINISTQGPSWLSGGEFGVEGSIISILIQVILIIWLYFDIFKTEKMTIMGKFDLNEIHKLNDNTYF